MQLPVPSSVKALQKKLVEEQSHVSQRETRSDRLQRQLCLIQRMQEQLLVQAAQAAESKYKEWLTGSSQAQWAGTFGTSTPQVHRSVRSQNAPSASCFDGGTSPGSPPPQEDQPHVSLKDRPRVSLKEQLQALAQEDAGCVMVARRIAKLGFNSAEKLRLYFMPYGEVKCVHVAHAWSQGKYWRAGSVGFVVMSSTEAVQAIVQGGPAHIVCGVVITVHPFRP